MNVNRSSQQSAIVLRISPFGENHGMVDLLTAESGLVPAVAFGLRSRRSSLRGKVVPFARGTVWLYRDPRQERSKITDFDVLSYALDLQSNLTAFYHASLWAEVVWRTHASGDAGAAAYRLLSEGLDLVQAMIVADPSQSGTILVRQVGLGFLWRYLGVLGLQPELDYCVAAERPFQRDEARFYRPGEGGLVSGPWAGPGTLILPPRGVAFLRAAEDRGLPILAARALDEETLTRTRAVVLAAVHEAVDGPLNTLAVAGGTL